MSRVVDVDKITDKLKEKLKEPAFYHTGEDWYNGIITALSIIETEAIDTEDLK